MSGLGDRFLTTQPRFRRYRPKFSRKLQGTVVLSKALLITTKPARNLIETGQARALDALSMRLEGPGGALPTPSLSFPILSGCFDHKGPLRFDTGPAPRIRGSFDGTGAFQRASERALLLAAMSRSAREGPASTGDPGLSSRETTGGGRSGEGRFRLFDPAAEVPVVSPSEGSRGASVVSPSEGPRSARCRGNVGTRDLSKRDCCSISEGQPA